MAPKAKTSFKVVGPISGDLFKDNMARLYVKDPEIISVPFDQFSASTTDDYGKTRGNFDLGNLETSPVFGILAKQVKDILKKAGYTKVEVRNVGSEQKFTINKKATLSDGAPLTMESYDALIAEDHDDFHSFELTVNPWAMIKDGTVQVGFWFNVVGTQ